LDIFDEVPNMASIPQGAALALLPVGYEVRVVTNRLHYRLDENRSWTIYDYEADQVKDIAGRDAMSEQEDYMRVFVQATNRTYMWGDQANPGTFVWQMLDSILSIDVANLASRPTNPAALSSGFRVYVKSNRLTYQVTVAGTYELTTKECRAVDKLTTRDAMTEVENGQRCFVEESQRYYTRSGLTWINDIPLRYAGANIADLPDPLLMQNGVQVNCESNHITYTVFNNAYWYYFQLTDPVPTYADLLLLTELVENQRTYCFETNKTYIWKKDPPAVPPGPDTFSWYEETSAPATKRALLVVTARDVLPDLPEDVLFPESIVMYVNGLANHAGLSPGFAFVAPRSLTWDSAVARYSIQISDTVIVEYY
jgi:hypothetical protein